MQGMLQAEERALALWLISSLQWVYESWGRWPVTSGKLQHEQTAEPLGRLRALGYGTKHALGHVE